MDVKEQLKSKSLSELFMLIRNGSGAMTLSTSEEIERRLSAQQTHALDAATVTPKCTTDRLCPVHNVWHAAPPHK